MEIYKNKYCDFFFSEHGLKVASMEFPATNAKHLSLFTSSRMLKAKLTKVTTYLAIVRFGKSKPLC